MSKINFGAQYRDDSTIQDNNESFGDGPMGDMPNIPRELKNRVHFLEEQITELYDVVAEDASRSADVIEHVIIERPWMSVMLAFGLGCATAALLRPARRY